MFPFEVDPGWYGNYWYSDRPRPQQRRAFSGNVARFAVLVLLLAGSGVVLSHVHDKANASVYQDWEEE